MKLKDYTAIHTQVAIAKLIGIAPSFVNQWVSGNRPVPITACVAIERVTNGAVTRQELRPDDWWLIWPELISAEGPHGATPPAAPASTTQGVINA
jgi:DNA-binding transcriptional regulator YdaS (Cro superfamily)